MEESIEVREENEKKRRKLTSKVWDDFTRSESGEDGKRWAICNHCGGKFDGCSKKGTTHLKNHLMSKICRDKRNGGDGNEDISTQIRDLTTLDVMKEKSTVLDFIKQSFEEDIFLTRHWDPSGLNSRKEEILQVYQQEKDKLGQFFSKLSCRLSLHINYLCGDNLILTAHYIDDSWKRQIMFIRMLPLIENWQDEIKKTCLELNIDRNMCCIIVPESFFFFQDDDDDDDEVTESWNQITATFEHLKAWDESPYKFNWANFSTTTRVVHILKLLRFHINEGCRLCKDVSYKKLFDVIKVYLFVAILDPRLKTDIEQLLYEEICGRHVDDCLEETINYFRDIYNEYARESSYHKLTDTIWRPSTSSTKSELDLYLHGLKIPAEQEFDILDWWRGNALFYPTLARMARDYLAMPIQPIDIDSPLKHELVFM